eukprot:CAMPEP_0118943164 /NCGR_PEP_ID=MMETSP1169-20130426/37669_1 /TAXON_ID=36882 /ORGANISM="Pyramimonas obovata, Strain CCMP722" /LENGTH=293 /DNA_ID=CAMNT_0006888341 /DNA_START=296 /DNA_END=1174 /DNA_ORIENTATION=-
MEFDDDAFLEDDEVWGVMDNLVEMYNQNSTQAPAGGASGSNHRGVLPMAPSAAVAAKTQATLHPQPQPHRHLMATTPSRTRANREDENHLVALFLPEAAGSTAATAPANPVTSVAQNLSTPRQSHARPQAVDLTTPVSARPGQQYGAAAAIAEPDELGRLREQVALLTRSVMQKEDSLSAMSTQLRLKDAELGEMRDRSNRSEGRGNQRRTSGIPGDLSREVERLKQLLMFKDEEVQQLKQAVEAERPARPPASNFTGASTPGPNGAAAPLRSHPGDRSSTPADFTPASNASG